MIIMNKKSKRLKCLLKKNNQKEKESKKWKQKLKEKIHNK
jgi:hypothetical protein